MAEYLRAEIYKFTHRRIYLFGALGTLLGGELLLLFLLKFASGEAVNTFDSVVKVLSMVLSMGLYLVVVVCDMVFSDQYKVDTLKNEVAYGIPRVRIYLGKLCAAILASVAICAVMLIFYLAAGKVMFATKSPLPQLFALLGSWLVFSLPLWLGGLGFFLMLLFLLRGSTAASVFYVLMVAVLGQLLDTMAIFLPAVRTVSQVVDRCLLTSPFATMNSGSPDYLWPWAVGMGWLVLSTAVGLAAFHRREIS